MNSQVTVNSFGVHYQPRFNLTFGCELSELPEHDLSRTVQKAVIDSGMLKVLNFDKRLSHGFPVIAMLTAVLLAFAEWGYASTRMLARFCEFDKRYIYLFDGLKPSHMAFERFIKDHLPADRLEICLAVLNDYIKREVPVNTADMHIDGTKFEANANKFTFVWRKSAERYRGVAMRNGHKAMADFNEYLIAAGHPEMCVSLLVPLTPQTFLNVRDQAAMVLESEDYLFRYGIGRKKHPLQKVYEILSEAALRLYTLNHYLKLMGDRNSLSKTDPDATMLHMKYDYYCNTGVFKAGYNVQMGVCDGFIWDLYVSSDANDMGTYIPFMEAFYDHYGYYPENVSADAGYGSYDNYMFNAAHGINSFIKYSHWLKEQGHSKKDQCKSWNFKLNEEGTVICPAGNEMYPVSNKRDYRSEKAFPRFKTTYTCDNCEDCPLRDKCFKGKGNKKISKTTGMDELYRDAREKLSSDKGKQLRKDRSTMAEGVFGQIKEDYNYVRIRRRGMANVKKEFLIIAMSFNLRKLHTVKQRQNEEPNILA